MIEIPCNNGAIRLASLTCHECGKEMDYITAKGNRCYECIEAIPIRYPQAKVKRMSLEEAKRTIESSFTPKQ
jgi:threonine synthase